MEIGAFLHELRRFVADDQQIFVGNKTINLLDETVDFIQDLMGAKAKVVEVPNEANATFLHDLDPSHFQLQRNIMCRLCNVSFCKLSFHLYAMFVRTRAIVLNDLLLLFVGIFH